MKKIFAIALAVVMVLSMASAFALSQCATWGTNWDCLADDLWCGQGKVEVVPYVKVNTACGWEYQASDCATAIRSENVYWAIKLTVEAYPDADFWAEAKIDLESKGLDAYDWEYDGAGFFVDLPANGLDVTATEEKVYYAAEDGKLYDASAKTFKLENVMWESEVKEDDYCSTEGYSVCAKLVSYYDGFSNIYYNEVGDYYFEIVGQTWADNDHIVAKKNLSTVGMDDTLKIWDVDAKGVKVNEVVITIKEGAIKDINWENATAAFYNAVMADFGFVNCGTSACLFQKNFFNNFGWDFAQEDCFDWSTKGASVVDTDCVVAIPKTGDASVLAWLF